MDFSSNLQLGDLQIVPHGQKVLKICTEHGSETAGLCVKIQNDISTEHWIVIKLDFARSEFKMRLKRISYNATAPGCTI